MVEFVKLEQKAKRLDKETRTKLIIYTYVINFNLFLILFNLYDGGLLKWGTFFLINSFIVGVIARQTNINNINGWVIVFAIINFFVFGIGSLMFTFNMLVIVINLLYLKYIIKNLHL